MKRISYAQSVRHFVSTKKRILGIIPRMASDLNDTLP